MSGSRSRSAVDMACVLDRAATPRSGLETMARSAVRAWPPGSLSHSGTSASGRTGPDTPAGTESLTVGGCAWPRTGSDSGTLTAPRSEVAARMASASSPVVPYRWAGFLASPRATTSSTAAGRPGWSVLGAGGTALSWAHMTATISPAKGALPGQALVQHAGQRVHVGTVVTG